MESLLPCATAQQLLTLWTTIVFFSAVWPGVRSLTIRVTIQEERAKGTVICDLMSETSFQDILQRDLENDPFRDPSISPRLHFSILTSGNPFSQYFSVGENTGVVVTTQNIDREIVCSFRDTCQLTFEVAARSVYGSFFTLAQVEVTILDKNDNAPEFGQSEFELFIPENSDSGRSFQLPTAFDRDRGVGNGVEGYQLLTDETSFGLETIETASNTSDVFLTLKSTLNRETAAAYTVLVGAVDGGQPSLTGTLTVKVLISDINDNFPVFERSIYSVNVAEDKGLNHPVIQITATDADEGPNGELLYSFSSQQPPANLAYFRIDRQTGEIFLTRSLESLTGQELELVVEARDQGHPPKVSRCQVKIFVEDTINSMPEIIIDTLGGIGKVSVVSEYADAGKVVLHVSVKDPDSGENGRTSCLVDSPEFELRTLGIEDKYKIVLKSALDRETIEMYNVTISCEDHGFPSLLATKKFAVKVSDENDNPPEFSHRSYETSMFENNTIGMSVIQLSVTDKDIGINAEIDYTVMGTNRKYFTVNPDGLMTAKISLNREESGRIITKVVASDRGVPPLSSSTTVVVDLLDINDMPPVFSQAIYHFEVAEEQKAGRYVGIVSATDQDLGKNKKISYRLADQSGSNFDVGMDGGVITTKRILDREIEDIYEISVLAIDHGVPALTGSTKVIIQLLDVNDNLPFFLYPNLDNDTLTIPHSLKQDRIIVTIKASDNDTGPNGQLVYSLSSLNETSPFAINSDTGDIYLHRTMSTEDIGLYTLTLVAIDKGEKHQWSTQTPLFVDVYFDNSTLFSLVNSAGPSKTMITIIVAVASVVLLAFLTITVFICIRRYEMRKKSVSRFPVSASTSSTTKLQGGYYIAPGVQSSTSSIFGKHEDVAAAENSIDSPQERQTTNPYVVMLSRPEVGPSEIVEIGHGSRLRLNNTFNSVDLDQTDDEKFSTFKSQDNIFVERRHNSLRRPSVDTCEKRRNDTFDNEDLSCDSTSDSGRGGSDVDVNNGATASKARAAAATPISVKSGISDRLSPLPRDQLKGTFLTFRGESPSSFKFDSDSDTTLTRPSHKSAFKPMPMISSPVGARNADMRTPRQSESDTDSEITAPGRFHNQTPAVAGIYSPHTGAGIYSGDRVTLRQPYRVAPLPMFMPPSSFHRSDSEPEHSDAGSNQSNASSRRNFVPRLPMYPGIEFSHHAYGGSNRNSIGAFSNISSSSNRDSRPIDTDRSSNPQGPNYINNRPYSISNDSSQSTPTNSLYNNGDPFRDMSTDPRVSNNYDNVISELETSRPVSMEDDFLLPPYPQADGEEERDNLLLHHGYTGFSTPERDREQDALVMRSQFESSA